MLNNELKNKLCELIIKSKGNIKSIHALLQNEISFKNNNIAVQLDAIEKSHNEMKIIIETHAKNQVYQIQEKITPTIDDLI